MKKWFILGLTSIVVVIIGVCMIMNIPKTTLSATIMTNNHSVPAGQLLRLTFKANNGQTAWLNITPQVGKNPDKGGFVFGAPGGRLYISSEDGKQYYVTSFVKGNKDVHLDLNWYIDGNTAVFKNLSGSDTDSVKSVIHFKLNQ